MLEGYFVCDRFDCNLNFDNDDIIENNLVLYTIFLTCKFGLTSSNNMCVCACFCFLLAASWR